jgi:hypothetical protein
VLSQRCAANKYLQSGLAEFERHDMMLAVAELYINRENPSVPMRGYKANCIAKGQAMVLTSRADFHKMEIRYTSL